MIKYKTEKQIVTNQIREKIVCDVCKKEFSLTGNECFEAQEFIQVHQTCGYGSIFGDTNIIQLDMCQHCAKKILGDYIRIVEYTDDLSI